MASHLRCERPRERSSAYARSLAVDRLREVPVAHDLKLEITWRATGRLASRPFASNLRRAGPAQALRPVRGPRPPVGADVRGPINCI